MAASPDTTWTVTFRLNMTKAVRMGIFDPASGHIHLLTGAISQPQMMVREPGDVYTCSLTGEFSSGVNYTYHFRINDSIEENVSRSFTTKPGLLTLSDWWNNEPLNITTFRVNMSFAAQAGRFNPLSDSVCIVGTMNNLQGSPKLTRDGSSLIYYRVDSSLTPGVVYRYRYRINHDSAGYELLNETARMIRIPDTLLVLNQDFDNFNPARQPMTFRCNMRYYISKGQFDPASDYLDIAGNFDGMGGNDVLFDSDADSVYSLDIQLDTTWFSQGPLRFKFRINGDWNTSELTGKPDRSYIFHDSTGGTNLYSCHYNDLDPSVLTPPWAEQVDIQGLLIYKKFLSGIYSYQNVNGIPEGISTYQWYRCDNPQGTGATAIDSATRITYTVDTLDISKWLIFEVTPKAAWGDSATGKPMRAISSWNISAWDVGMDENRSPIRQIYPNPAYETVRVVTNREIAGIEITDLSGRVLFVRESDSRRIQVIPVSQLSPGVYLIHVRTLSGQSGSGRFIKLPDATR